MIRPELETLLFTHINSCGWTLVFPKRPDITLILDLSQTKYTTRLELRTDIDLGLVLDSFKLVQLN